MRRDAASIPDGWRKTQNDKGIEKSFVFDDFDKAFGFMTCCKKEIDALNHHPEWLNIYNKVFVSLTTHDTGGISELDIDLAHKMDQVFKTFKT